MTIACCLTLGALLAGAPLSPPQPSQGEAALPATLVLPAPRLSSPMSIEEALRARRSVRQWREDALPLADVAQVLWAAQGVTDSDGGRAAPSAGALYPLELHVLAGRVDGLAPGHWRYVPRTHSLVSVADGDRRAQLAEACRGQDWVALAPVVLVTCGVEARTSARYGARARRYVEIEAGCVAQDVALQSVALGLGTVVVGAFDDAALARVLSLPAGEAPLLVMPVGRPR